MKMSVRAVALTSACALSLFAGGCSSTSGSSTANTTASETNTITGAVSATASVDLDTAYNAAKDAVKRLQFNLVSDAKDALTGVLKAKTADNKSVEIKVTKKSEKITDIVVDAGLIDRSLAQTTMDSIRRNIGN